MSGTVDARLKELGIELPAPAAPAANYIPYTVVGSTVFVAGQICIWNGEMTCVGRLGENVSTEDGYQAARICGLNLIAQVRAACGGARRHHQSGRDHREIPRRAELGRAQ